MSGLLERGVDALERIATALEGFAGGTATAAKPEPAAEKPKADKPKADKPKAEKPDPVATTATREDVRDALKAVQKKHDAETARGVLAKFDVTSISALDEGKYAEVVAAAKEAVA